MNVSQAHVVSHMQPYPISEFISEGIAMAMNRIQFQPGLSMPEFFQQYRTEAQCEAALEKARWPEGRVALCVTPRGAPAAHLLPGCDEVFVYDKRGADRGPSGLWRIARRVRCDPAARMYRDPAITPVPRRTIPLTVGPSEGQVPEPEVEKASYAV